MSWEPTFNPLVCPFCGRACDLPKSEASEPVRLADASGFDRENLLASCGCGARLIVDIEIHEDEAQLSEWASREGRDLDVRFVRHVDFLSVSEESEGEWDGDWADALFYRFPS